MTTGRTLFRLAAASLLATPVAAAAQERLGLAERRAIAAYRKDSCPATEQGIQQAAGFPVPVEVEWDQLAQPGDAASHARDDCFGKTISSR